MSQDAGESSSRKLQIEASERQVEVYGPILLAIIVVAATMVLRCPSQAQQPAACGRGRGRPPLVPVIAARRNVAAQIARARCSGDVIAAGDSDGRIHFISAQTGKKPLYPLSVRGHTGSRDKTVLIWGAAPWGATTLPEGA